MALVSTGTSADQIAVGTESQRPASPVPGQVRFNTDEECLEVYGIFNGVGDWKCTGGSVCHVLPPSQLPSYGDNEQGDLWYNTEDGKLYVWYDDGVGPPNAQWVDASPKTRLGQEKRFGIIGEVVAFGGRDVPDGWLECNGGSIPSKYTELRAVVGNNVPDLRGEFIRGWSNGRGVDAGRGLLSTQGQNIQSHSHGINAGGSHTHLFRQHNISFRGTGGDDMRADDKWSMVPTSSAGSHSHGVNSSGGSETRPRNVALMYIIYAGED